MSPRGPLPWDSVLSSSDILIFLLTCSVSLSSSLCFLDATDAVPLAATKPVTLDLVYTDLFFDLISLSIMCCDHRYISEPFLCQLRIIGTLACYSGTEKCYVIRCA